MGIALISPYSLPVHYRNLVSASQDGKLIVWDGYTTNKVSCQGIPTPPPHWCVGAEKISSCAERRAPPLLLSAHDE